jgi:hypothetical protein
VTKKLRKKASKSLGALSRYSEMLTLPIEEFTEKIKTEVADRFDTRAAFERNDKSSIERALAHFHGLHAHLLAEYRIIKFVWLKGFSHFKKTETGYINFQRKELPSKTVEKQIERITYEAHGDELFRLKDEADAIEQKMKFVHGMSENVKNSLSAIQSLSRLVVTEMGAAKHD